MSKRDDERRIERPATVPAQEDEADIVEEVGAEIDENGELRASIEDVRKAGALDVETVRRNRQSNNVAKKKQNGEKVSFSSNDPLVKYEDLLKAWPTSTMHVKLRRLSGGPEVTELITSFPRTASELYEEIKVKHGQCADASYEVEFYDASSKEWRGRSKITMADARPQYMRGQPMQPPNGGYPPPQGYPPQQPPNGAPAPASTDPMTMFRQMWDLVQSVQPQSPQPQPMPPWTHQPAMPAPPTNPDPASMMKWFQEMFAIVRQAQPAPAPVVHSPQPQAHPHQGPQLPNTPAPPGYRYTWLPDSNCCVLEPINRPMPERREPMYRGQREPPGQRPYYPQGEQIHDNGPYDRYGARQAPPDPLREQMSTLRRAMALREELDELLGGGGQRSGMQLDGAPEQDPDSPVIVERTADVDLVRNREDGSIRGWDTFLVNMPSMLKKGSEFVKEISKTATEERQRRERAEQQRLPPGYVRMTEGYEAPEGFVAVPVRQAPPPEPPPRAREPDLPQPPAHMPPPIEEEPEPPPQRGWDEDLS